MKFSEIRKIRNRVRPQLKNLVGQMRKGSVDFRVEALVTQCSPHSPGREDFPHPVPRFQPFRPDWKPLRQPRVAYSFAALQVLDNVGLRRNSLKFRGYGWWPQCVSRRSLQQNAMPGFSFPTVGPLGLSSPPSRSRHQHSRPSVLWSAKTSKCPSRGSSLFAILP